MTDSKPSIIFHIGQHKTGSKALQSFLAHNHQRLLDHHILYPIDEGPRHGVRAYAISQYLLFASIRREALAVCADQARADRYWEGQRGYCAPHDSAFSLFEAVATQRERMGATRVIMSAEDLFDMQTSHEIAFSLELVEAGARRLARLAADFGYEARVVVYLRRQDHLLGAHYGQYIKGSPVHDVDFDEFAVAFSPRLDSRRILSAWSSAFGPGRIHVRAYERPAMPDGIVPDFLHQISIFPVPAEWTQPELDVESVNRSPGRDWIEYIRILNRRTALSQPVFARDDVLETALRAEPFGDVPAGIASWLSPVARRELLATYFDGNDAIARDFPGRGAAGLFEECPPGGDEHWKPYAGLTAPRATAISLAVHETVVGRTKWAARSDSRSTSHSIELQSQ